jgi:RNA polymerase sigma factor (TIGR02999 family)
MEGPEITQLLKDFEDGAENAFEELLAGVYPELKKLARAKLRNDRPGDTLNTTGLVHEAYLSLARYQEMSFNNRAHFFGAAAKTMRRIIVDHARSKSTHKRKGQHVTLSGLGSAASVSMDQVLEIDDALARLEKERPRWVRIIECRYFAGLNIVETAAALDISHGTVSNDWRLARAWLRREMDA